MNGLLFLEKLVFVWVYFQILWWHIPTKTKLEYPQGFDHGQFEIKTLPIHALPYYIYSYVQKRHQKWTEIRMF